MTADILERSSARSTDLERILLSCDESGAWTLSGTDSPVRQFDDFAAALDSARDACGSKPGTIEVWQGSEYICCLSPQERPPRAVSIRSVSVDATARRRALTVAERYANRAAHLLLATAGPLFWFALMFVALAASLGWRLALL